jgi:hypothetical protein
VSTFDNVQWRKSSRSGQEGTDCVELAGSQTQVGIRDSKRPEAGHLALSQAAFRQLAGRAKSGVFDRVP